MKSNLMKPLQKNKKEKWKEISIIISKIIQLHEVIKSFQCPSFIIEVANKKMPDSMMNLHIAYVSQNRNYNNI